MCPTEKNDVPIDEGGNYLSGATMMTQSETNLFSSRAFPVGAQGSIGYTRSRTRFTTTLDRILCHLLVLSCERTGITNYGQIGRMLFDYTC